MLAPRYRVYGLDLGLDLRFMVHGLRYAVRRDEAYGNCNEPPEEETVTNLLKKLLSKLESYDCNEPPEEAAVKVGVV
jgi:hypothetical protein